MALVTRGVRNNNPGNLDYIPPPRGFTGQVGVELVPVGEHFVPRFGRYDTAHNGIRALAKQVLIDNQHHGKASVADIIGSWAPPSENDTRAYIAVVAGSLGLGQEEINSSVDARVPATNFTITKAIIHQENGYQPYSDEDISSAVADAIGVGE